MIRVLKAREMAYADENTIKLTGIDSIVLMENAGRTASEIILNRYRDKNRFTIVAGSGNNGGDGLVIARYLLKAGKDVKVFVLSSSKEKLSPDNLKNFEIFELFDGKILLTTEEKLIKLRNGVKWADVVIDAVFGTGFVPPVKGYREKAIDVINKYGKEVVAVDIPSGLSADTGKVEGLHVKADITITFAFPKLCHILYPACEFCGDVYVVDISIDEKYVSEIHRYIIEAESLKLPQRKKNSHKYTYGHVLVIGGSRGKTGAVIMASKSATVSGAGLVTAVIPESLDTILEQSLIEEMTIPVNEEDGKFGKNSIKQIRDIIKNGKFSSIVIGMGMSVNRWTQRLVEEILKIKKPIVIDADGLNNLSLIENFEDKLRRRKQPTILTPHIGEMARLIRKDTGYVLDNIEEVAIDFSTKTNSYVVLKSARTLISTPDGKVFFSIFGNEGMATAGTGDVLAGILGAMINRLQPEDAVLTGVSLHGLSGDFAVRYVGKESLKATDLITYIKDAYSYLDELKVRRKEFSFYRKIKVL